MKLLEEIISLASTESASISTLLRKCLVLAYTLRNDRLKSWVESELNGYESQDTVVPEYRKTAIHAKGLFLGGFGAQINNQPIPSTMLREEHRHWAEFAELKQPIASYEGVSHGSRLVIEWPGNLVGLYQSALFEGRYALNRAWQEIPSTVILGFIDTIKTRVLRFSLELKDELGEVSDDPNELPREKVDQNVNTYIFGGTNVIASKDFVQVGSIDIAQGNWQALSDALSKNLGITAPAIAELKSSLDEDAKETPPPSLGSRTATWLKQLGKKSGEVALSVATDVAKKEAAKWILGYLGLPS